MAEGNNPHAPNTTVPDLHVAVLLWTATMDSFLNNGIVVPRLNLHLNNTGPDYGLDLLSNHLNLIRSWSESMTVYARNVRTVLEGVKFDELLLDMFRTEFHMKFLWGSKGVGAPNEQRYDKFEQVLSALSARCEPS